jgi:branched-chain amino acid transport system substrate-binding protein
MPDFLDQPALFSRPIAQSPNTQSKEKQMSMKHTVALVLTCSGLALAAQSAAAQDIKIGSLSALTGSASQPGQSQRDAIKMVVDEVNAKGGIKGRKIQLFIEDDQLQPTVAANAARRLVFQNDVFAVIGTPNSPTALSALEVTMEAKVPHLVLGVAPKVTQMGNPYVLRVTPTDSILAAELVDYAVKKKGASKIAILSDSSDYGKGGLASATAALAKLNMKPVITESFNNEDKDFASQINKIKASGADSLILWGFYVEGAKIVSAAQKLGLGLPIFASSGVLQGNFLELAGSAAEGVTVVSYYSNADSAPQTKEFIAKWKKAYNTDPNPVAGLGYDSINMLLAAIEKVGTNREKVVAELKAMKNYPGVTGLKTGAPDGELGQGAIILQIKQGVAEAVSQ